MIRATTTRAYTFWILPSICIKAWRRNMDNRRMAMIEVMWGFWGLAVVIGPDDK